MERSMSTKTKIVSVLVALIAAFSAGRWLSPERIVTKTVTIEVEKKQTNTEKDKDTHTVVVETRKPDGTTEKTTTIDTAAHTDTKTTDMTKTDTEMDKTVTYSESKTTILFTYGFVLGSASPTYGGSVSRPVFGPLSLGVSGNSSGLVSVGIGLTL